MLFVDLKAAFDNVARDILWRELRRKGIKEMLIRKLESIYAQTKVVIRTSQRFTKSFKTKKSVHQGCVLFNLYVADIERLKNREIGGVTIG